MTSVASPSGEHPPPAKMTIRVYRVNRYGAVVQEYGSVSVPPAEGSPPFTSAYPACECPNCRTGDTTSR
ncbi:hypothetical protein ACE1SV_29660 [Streptomyces sp. E-15]